MLHPRYLWSRYHGVLMGLVIALAITSCSTAPPVGIHPVKPFDLNRYLGTWYEIARLDHRFERGLTDIQAVYSLRDDGSVKVLNRGRQTENGEWREAEGRALFTGSANEASLKVSFFGPFYGGYHVAALDPQYQWALIVGPDRDYFWILSRSPHISDALRHSLIDRAKAFGIQTDALIWTPQNAKTP